MKKILIFFFFLFTIFSAKAQCPSGAFALYTHYVMLDSNGPVDTTCSYRVSNFPTNSKVYFYDINNILVDSLITDNTGYGLALRTSLNCLFHYLGNGQYGLAISGSCSAILHFAELLPIKIKQFNLTSANNLVRVFWQLEEESVGTVYTLEESINGRDYYAIYTTQTIASSTPGHLYQHNISGLTNDKRFYRLMVKENSGSLTYSPVKSATSGINDVLDILPTIGSGVFTVNLPGYFKNGQIQIFTSAGSLVQTQKIASPVLNFEINSSAGLYHVRAIAPDGSVLTKTIVRQ